MHTQQATHTQVSYRVCLQSARASIRDKVPACEPLRGSPNAITACAVIWRHRHHHGCIFPGKNRLVQLRRALHGMPAILLC